MKPNAANRDALIPSSAETRQERCLRAFDPSVRAAIAALAASCERLQDLGESFPALLFALATGYGTPAARATAITGVKVGVPLRDIARRLDLAWWLRRLPASAFTAPLPRLPDDPDSALRLAASIPDNPRLCASWLQRVGTAEQACGGDFTIWVARHALTLPTPAANDDRFLGLAAWAWFSRTPGSIGHRLLARPWSAEIGPKTAMDAVTAWRVRISLHDWLGSGLKRGWIADGAAHGFEFATLLTAADFIATGAALHNCLDQFAPQLSCGISNVVAVRASGQVVACLEIAPHEHDVAMPAILQLRADHNRAAAAAIWQAAYAWLGANPIESYARSNHSVPASTRLAARRALWGPYLASIRSSALLQQVQGLANPAAPRPTRRPPVLGHGDRFAVPADLGILDVPARRTRRG